MWWSKEGGCMQKRESLDIPGTSGDHTDCTIGAENGCVLGSIVIQLLVQCVQCVLPGLPLPLCAGSPHPPPVPMWMQVLQLRNTFLEILNILFKKIKPAVILSCKTALPCFLLCAVWTLVVVCKVIHPFSRIRYLKMLITKQSCRSWKFLN